MLKKKWINYVFTPAIGFLPFSLYVILRGLMGGEFYPLTISFAFAFIGEICFLRFFKNRIVGTPFTMSGIAILFTFLTWALADNFIEEDSFYVILAEVVLSISCKLVLINKKFIHLKLFKRRNMQLRTLLDNFYFSITIIQPILITHLFIILLSRFLITPEELYRHKFLLYSLLPAFIPILTYIVFQLFRVKALNPKLNQEEWLPIINEDGMITGKIARSVSIKMKNQFMHPVVRIALVCNNQLYLQKRSPNSKVDPDKYDYPFEKYVQYNHQINMAVKNNISQFLGNNLELPFEFLLKYTFKNEDTNRLIFLYVVHLDDENILPKKNKLDGKFWTAKQIENAFSDGIFSEALELEFEYIKNTFLLPEEERNSFINRRQNA